MSDRALRTRRPWRAILPVIAVLASWALVVAAPLGAQDASQDFSEMSLEELLGVRVLKVNALGTHTHLAGEWMVGYRYMRMGMSGIRDGTESLTAEEVLQDFMVSPTGMTMEMHMVEAMYAPSDALTLMLMLPYRRQSMDHRTRMGESFTTQSQGVGDVTIGAHYTVLGDVRRTTHRLLLDGRLGLPTGSIHAHRRVDGGAEEQQLPYPMQLGSGTIHFGPGLTYLGESRRFAWMVQSASAIELGRNSHEYRLGDRLRLSAWAAWAPIGWLSPSLRMDGEMWGNIDGADPGLNPMMVPTADASKRAGTTLSLAPALGFYVPRGPFEGQRIAIEASVPLHQSLDGPQLERDWTLTVVWSWTF